MDRKSKVLLYLFFFLFVGTVMFSFARYIIFRDFEIMMSEEETVSEEPIMEEGSVDETETQETEESTVEETPSL